jgi:hypothetical protein
MMVEAFRAVLRKRYPVAYFKCNLCGYLCTEAPYWLEEAYHSPINPSDTGILQRNARMAKLASTILFLLHGRKGRFVDYAGGYGLLTRMMRDIGFDFYWYDPKCQNLFARGFEYGAGADTFELATCFEVFEHFIDPVTETGKILEISRAILFSTDLLPDPLPGPDDWWYYGLDHGQHVSFYTVPALRRIAGKYGMNLYSDGGGIHLMTKRRLSRGEFAAFVGLGHLGFAGIVRRMMKSRTKDDMRNVPTFP